jgi:DNA-binding NarL/FixJ family response regulator
VTVFGALFEGGKRHGVNGFSRETTSAQPSDFPIRISIVSEVRFLRESLAEVVPRAGTLLISGLFSNLEEALVGIVENQPDVVLLDEAFPDGHSAVGQIRCAAPQIPTVVIAVAESAEEVITWAEAGAAGYIPKTAGVADIAQLLVDIRRGEQPCPASVAAGLLRRISNGGGFNGRRQKWGLSLELTSREVQIAKLMAVGMSNKDIARRLSIGLATTKTHVHNILGKLNLQRRGQAASWMRAQRGLCPDL